MIGKNVIGYFLEIFLIFKLQTFSQIFQKEDDKIDLHPFLYQK